MKVMGNIRHRWMVLVVVAITTFATAHEAIKQYDGLREQASEWATSRLLATLLNTSAPAEELTDAQTVYASSRSVEQIRAEQPARQQSAPLTTYRLTKSVSSGAPQSDEATLIAVNETPARIETQHFELSEDDQESFERLSEVALLAEKSQAAKLDALGHLEEANEPEGAAGDDDAVDEAIEHTRAAIYFDNRANIEGTPHVGETMDIIAVRARAAADSLVQLRAARRALRALQERTVRPVRSGMRIIKKGNPTSATTTLRAAGPRDWINAATEDAECGPHGQLALHDTIGESAASGE